MAAPPSTPNYYQTPYYPAAQYRTPQYQAPQYQAPQYQTPQYQAPQHQTPQNQAPLPQLPGETTEWTNGLFGCCAKPGTFLCALFCPLCEAASVRSAFDSSDWLFNCCYISPCLMYNMVREGYNIEGDCVTDCLLNTFCAPCAITQASLEVDVRKRITRGRATGGEWKNGAINAANLPFFLAALVGCDKCAFAKIRTDYDESNLIFNIFVLSSCAAYSLIREGYGIDGNCVSDVLYVGLCPCCAASRLGAEVEARGKIFEQPGVQRMGGR